MALSKQCARQKVLVLSLKHSRTSKPKSLQALANATRYLRREMIVGRQLRLFRTTLFYTFRSCVAICPLCRLFSFFGSLCPLTDVLYKPPYHTYAEEVYAGAGGYGLLPESPFVKIRVTDSNLEASFFLDAPPPSRPVCLNMASVSQNVNPVPGSPDSPQAALLLVRANAPVVVSSPRGWHQTGSSLERYIIRAKKNRAVQLLDS